MSDTDEVDEVSIDRTRQQPLWFAVLAAELLPIVHRDPKGAFASEIGRLHRNALSGSPSDRDIEESLRWAESIGLLKSVTKNATRHPHRLERVYALTQKGAFALASDPYIDVRVT